MSLSDFLLEVGQAANGNPFYGQEKKIFQDLSDQQAKGSALADLAAQTPGGPNVAGPPTPANTALLSMAQQANDPQQRQQQFVSALQRLAAANPTKYGEEAMKAASPLAQMGAFADAQLKRAQASNLESEAIKNDYIPIDKPMLHVDHKSGEKSIVTPGGVMFLNGPRAGQSIGNTQAPPQTADASTTAGGTAAPDQGGGSDWASYGSATPAGQEAYKVHAQTRQKQVDDAYEAMTRSKIEQQNMENILDKMKSVNKKVPHGPKALIEAQELGSKAASVLPSGTPFVDATGDTAAAGSDWDKFNNQLNVSGISKFYESAKGGRMELPITHAILNAGGIDKTLAPEKRDEQIEQLREIGRNQVIAAHNAYNKLRDPNAKEMPLLNKYGTQNPDPSAPPQPKTLTMEQVKKNAAHFGMTVDQIIQNAKARGYQVQQ